MRLLVAISHHGLGHLAQAAPVLNALHATRPDLEFLVWSGVPHAALAARIHAPFQHRHEPADVGLAMHDAVRVDLAASTSAYLAFHQDWDARVADEAAWLRDQGIGGVLSDVACLPLAAAAQAGIPGVAMCSLNWVDIAGAYLAEQPGMATVLEQLEAAYRSARVFLRVLPAMPMDWLEKREAVPPIAALGVDRRVELRARLELEQGERLVLLGFGGIAYKPFAGPPQERLASLGGLLGRFSQAGGTDIQAARPLPALNGVRWLVPDDWCQERGDLIPFSRGGLAFLDLLASCDALVTKVGYGSFVEAAAAGIPVLYIDRPDWPETPYLRDWLLAHTRAAVIDEAGLFDPEVGVLLATLLAAPRMPRVALDGAAVAAQRVLELLGFATLNPSYDPRFLRGS
ncbi:MAG: hypothetical protein KKG92_13800 [Gammaproteobacteria bacterium]|nr:hypothetical protein [Gammaproteobacteria bacterium]